MVVDPAESDRFHHPHTTPQEPNRSSWGTSAGHPTTRATRGAFLVAFVGVLALTLAVGALAVSMTPHAPGTNESNTQGPLDRLHTAGITGEGVTVGIVDVTGFDTDDPGIADRIRATRAFGPEASVENGGRNAHGTAAATTVTQVAPGVELVLASFDAPGEYRRAVEWLVAQDVDVIVAPVSFYGTAGDGSSAVARAATAATSEGVTVVAPVGNLARGHWEGRYDPVRNGTLRFSGGTRNYLDGGREVTLWLSWDREHRGEDYTVELFRTDEEGTRLVARSQPYRVDDVPNERIVATLQPGTYFFVVRGPANATGARLELSSPTHEFQYVRPAGSVVAPATARGVTGVGAYNRSAGRVVPSSSRGPTRDGRLGVDLLGPDRPLPDRSFAGSSAAAAYVGGVAALVADADPGRSPREIEAVIERTAADTGPDGVDFATGYGRVSPLRAVRNATG